ncbi:hypothetical protein G5B37_14055 [Rasiella rasia]|uniref:Peptidase S74 domain-containing protein n=1 Tax=Rasiella rasia TaxID=2744027 RepID=A0A6G6GPW8_9FLAO|nr:tail fiber domain-containing protein [Rasiella rasia]QIE60645.1 hypothetical protein G5B37_14055 [Rasiella rasia]
MKLLQFGLVPQKSQFLFFLSLLFSTPFFAQVGIGTTNPDPSSILTIESTESGLLIPRMTASDRVGITNPATGLMVYQTDAPDGFYYYDGTTWQEISAGNTGWKTSGNAGTDATTDFIGTTDDEDVVFKRNNILYGTFFDQSLALGRETLFNNTTGSNLVAIGSRALFLNTVGDNNTAVGVSALRSNSTGSGNTALGLESLYSNSGGHGNSAVGFASLSYSSSGDNNTGMGNYSLHNNFSGSNNSGFGSYSLSNTSSGSFNTALGTSALTANTTGNYNTAIGYDAEVSGNNRENATAIGARALVAQDNSVVIGSIIGVNGASASTNVGIGTSSPNSSSVLDLTATDRGFLVPRMSSAQRIGITTPVRGLLVYQLNAPAGFYYYNGSNWNRITTGADVDHDFYEAGSTTAPDDINDDIYTMGNVAIGKNTADTPLEVERNFENTLVEFNNLTLQNGDGSFVNRAHVANTSINAVAFSNILTSTTAGSRTGIENSISGFSVSGEKIGIFNDIQSDNGITYGMSTTINDTGDDAQRGLRNYLIGEGTGDRTGTENIIFNSQDANHIGIFNQVDSDSDSGSKIGVSNDIRGNSTAPKYGTLNLIGGGSGNTLFYGTYNVFSGSMSKTGTTYASYNVFQGAGAENRYGGYYIFNNNGEGDHYGAYHDFSTTDTGDRYGTYNLMSNTSGNQYGTYNAYTRSGGTGNKYGTYTTIRSTSSGMHYGLYMDVLKPGSFAGYFLGDVSIGTTTNNNYILPASRGTNGQIMTTDASGNVDWVDLVTVNGINGLARIGDDIKLGGNLIENTRIRHFDNNLTYTLNGLGEFIVEEGTRDAFKINNVGATILGDNTYWRDGDSSGTTLASIEDSADDGRFRVYENGLTSVDLNANTEFVFNEQGLDRDFRVEGNGHTNLLKVDASTDNIGIRQFAPIFDLHLKQSINLTTGNGGMAFESSTNTNHWRIYHSGAHFSFNENGTRRAYIETASGNYIQPSDARLKQDFELQSGYLTKLKQVPIYTYRYKNQQGEKRSLGVKAQEIQPLFPELISEGEDGYLGMNYAGLSVVAIQAIKEQQVLIDNLAAENENLKEKTKTLEKRLDQLLSRLEVVEARLD